MSTETTRVSSYFRAEGYKDSAGTLFNYTNARLNSAMADTSGLTATAAFLNGLLYGTTRYKVYIGSTIATNDAVATTVTAMGISTALFAFITPHVASVVAGTIVTQTGVQYKVLSLASAVTQVTADLIVFGVA